jgi:uncharacterized damage-inducible protein DinB
MIHSQLIDSFRKIFERDLNKLAVEINSYADEASIWIINGEIKNSAGTLALHLCGNLSHYIGHVLGKSDYVRDREAEFASRNIARRELLSHIEETRSSVLNALSNLRPESLDEDYPEKVFDYPMTTCHFLIHLASHLGYHLGQVNYHRRLTSPKR